MKPFYITTAIDYTNAPPHIGHAYEKIFADSIARYHRTRNPETFFLTGVDQHGQKVQQAAEKLGIAPAEFAASVTEKFRELWRRLDISNDAWAATSAPEHRSAVQKILSRLHDAGQLYKATHKGFYSVRQEQFLTDKERGPDGEFGPEWGEVVFLEEDNWYFRLSEHREWLSNYLAAREDAVIPAFRQTELANAVGKGAGDLCISRPKSRLAWGIELPFDPAFVTYVWFDALINYISFAGYLSDNPAAAGRFERIWPADAHVIGKDILVPAHGIYWLCMLHAMGFEDDDMPALLVHGWWNLGGAKISKSLGNTIDPNTLVDRFGTDAVRYYFLRDITTGRDADFSIDRLVMLYNTELANGLGNLLNRSLNMARRYRAGAIQPFPESPDPHTSAFLAVFADHLAEWEHAMDGYQVQDAIAAASHVVEIANGFAESMAPWKLAKDPASAGLLDEVLTALVLAARLATTLLEPVIPSACSRIFEQLRLPAIASGENPAELARPHQCGEPSPVFPRIEPLPEETA